MCFQEDEVPRKINRLWDILRKLFSEEVIEGMHQPTSENYYIGMENQ